jgi:hypothetical protein
MTTSTRLRTALAAVAVAGLVAPAVALAEDTKCDEAGRGNTPVTTVVHEAHEATDGSALQPVSDVLHEAEILTCAP